MRRPRRVPTTPVPPAIRPVGHRAPPRAGARHRIAPASTRETSRHGLLPSARPTKSSSPRGLPRAAAQWPLGSRPRFARDRDVALGALAARRPLCRAIAARHVGHLPVPPQRQTLRPATPPCGGEWLRRNIPRRHYARINRVLSRPLAAAGPEAGLAPRHYRIAATPRRTPHGSCDDPRRRRVVTGAHACSPSRRFPGTRTPRKLDQVLSSSTKNPEYALGWIPQVLLRAVQFTTLPKCARKHGLRPVIRHVVRTPAHMARTARRRCVRFARSNFRLDWLYEAMVRLEARARRPRRRPDNSVRLDAARRAGDAPARTAVGTPRGPYARSLGPTRHRCGTSPVGN